MAFYKGVQHRPVGGQFAECGPAAEMVTPEWTMVLFQAA